MAYNFDGKCPYCLVHAHFSYKWIHRAHPRDFFLASCAACSAAVLVEMENGNIIRVSPGLRRTFPHSDYTTHVPERVRYVFDQAYAAAKEQAWTLVGLGCRTALERALKLLQAKGKDFAEKLDDLKTKFPGVAVPLEHADLVRLVGNAAAHEAGFDLSQEQAEAALEFSEQVLMQVYILPARAKAVIASLPQKQKGP